MTPSTEALAKLPVVVILGATATGKSKLAVNLALKFKGEVISADSIQVYKGLDILTNKVTVEEMKGVPHHMISIVEANQRKYDITCFRNQALPIVERILGDGKIPFIVGGTNYYIESLLWKVLVDETSRHPSPPTSTKWKADTSDELTDNPKILVDEIIKLFVSSHGRVESEDLESCSSDQLHCALSICDPKRASSLHPMDRRKVLRSLQICYQTGMKHSEILSQQRKMWDHCEDSTNWDVSHLGGPLRFENSLCFWIQADKKLLHDRIDKRVDDMVEKGLRLELNNYFDTLKEKNDELDYSRGILQSIGFKEFSAYLQLPKSERHSKLDNALFNVGIDILKLATRQYSKKQVQWINQRFLQPKRRQVPPIYGLDGNLTDAESWDINITRPAETLLENYLQGNFEHPIFAEKRVQTIEDREDDLIVRTCEICEGRAFVGIRQWEAHLVGRRHKKMKNRNMNRELRSFKFNSDPQNPSVEHTSVSTSEAQTSRLK